jgi:hypothetical protein
MHFVDKILLEEGRKEGRAAFEKDIGVIEGSETAEERGQARVTDGICRKWKRHDATRGEGTAAALGGARELVDVREKDGSVCNGADELAGRGKAAGGVNDDPRGDARGMTDAGGEERIVFEGRVDANDDGVHASAELVDKCAGGFGADPF